MEDGPSTSKSTRPKRLTAQQVTNLFLTLEQSDSDNDNSDDFLPNSAENSCSSSSRKPKSTQGKKRKHAFVDNDDEDDDYDDETSGANVFSPTNNLFL